MRILCLDAEWGGGDAVAEGLRAAGHDVVRCHDVAAGPSAPCIGLDRPGACPLDAEGGVDVAVDVRPAGAPHPTAREAGVTCALREGVPLVVAGATDPDPFARWAVAVAHDGDVAGACDEALRRAQDDLGRTVAIAATQAIGGPYRAGKEVRADVARRGNELLVRVHRPAEARALDGAIATHAHRAVRAAHVRVPATTISCVDG